MAKHIKNEDKFHEVFLYILSKIDTLNTTETTLYNILYFVDFDFYEKYEEQLMGLTYIRDTYGVVPLEFNRYVLNMKKQKDIKICYDGNRRNYIPLKSPRITSSKKESTLVDNVINGINNKYIAQDVPCRCTTAGEVVEYEAVFYRTPKYSVKNYDKD